MIIGLVLFGIIAVVAISIILVYNGLVSLRNNVKNSWSGIDVQLKRRSDLIPNLINTVKGYAKHEKDLLEKVTEARAAVMKSSGSGDVKQAAKDDNMLSGALKSLFAVAENYPDLKANQNFLKLQEDLTETEDQIAASRRIYNENVTYFNNKVEQFPSNLIAGMFSFKQADFFEAPSEAKETPKVAF